MGAAYKPIFLIPRGANRLLGEDGWEFLSAKRLAPEVVPLLAKKFSLAKIESYLGITSYTGDGLKASVICDDVGLIELISIQVHCGLVDEVRAKIDDLKIVEIELFVPNKK